MELSRTKKCIVTIFILFNFMMIVRHFMPLKESKIFRFFYTPASVYQSAMSLYQSWEMFAPNPARTNIHISAEIVFDDGSKMNWNFPRSSEMSIVERYVLGERWRKLLSEGVRKDKNKLMWEDAAKYVLRKNRDVAYIKIPVQVNLYRHWWRIPLVSEKFIPHDHEAQTEEVFKFYTYEVLK